MRATASLTILLLEVAARGCPRRPPPASTTRCWSAAPSPRDRTPSSRTRPLTPSGRRSGATNVSTGNLVASSAWMISRIDESSPPGVSIRITTAASPRSAAASSWPVTNRAVTGSMARSSTTSRTTGSAAATGTPRAAKRDHRGEDRPDPTAPVHESTASIRRDLVASPGRPSPRVSSRLSSPGTAPAPVSALRPHPLAALAAAVLVALVAPAAADAAGSVRVIPVPLKAASTATARVANATTGGPLDDAEVDPRQGRLLAGRRALAGHAQRAPRDPQRAPDAAVRRRGRPVDRADLANARERQAQRAVDVGGRRGSAVRAAPDPRPRPRSRPEGDRREARPRPDAARRAAGQRRASRRSCRAPPGAPTRSSARAAR